MGFKCGIVGLPNVGKSTLFNALTNAGVASANYPFCTIDPNVGVVSVPDQRLNVLAEIVHPERMVPTVMQFVDVAGLVKGASKGEGLGNKFLANIRETDAIAHVVRCFEHEDVAHVYGRIDPLYDIEIIETELALADLDAVEKALHKADKTSKSGDPKMLLEKQVFEKVHAHLGQGLPARTLALEEDEGILLARLFLLTAKPVLFIANVAEEGFVSNAYLDAVEAYAKKGQAQVVVISAALEAEISKLEDEEKQEFLQALGMEAPGLDRVIQRGYELLSLQTYFTAGVKEVRAWTILKNTRAPQAAAVIHSDFEKGFIRAEVIAYEDFVKYRGEAGAREAGKLRLEGKEYVVCEGDVMHFRFNV